LSFLDGFHFDGVIILTDRRLIIIDPDTYDEQAYFAKTNFWKSNGNTWHLSCLLNDPDIELTMETREFIASVLDGSAQRHLELRAKRAGNKNKKKKKYYRDLKIYWAIDDLLSKGVSLTSSAKKNGAACQVAEVNRITEDAAIQIYKRMKPKPDD